MKNEYKITGDSTIIYIKSPKYGLVEAVISTSDLPKAMEFPNAWCAVWCKGTSSFYISGKHTISFKKRKYVYLHRWILGISNPKTVVDHIDHDTLNNTRDNLNVVTQAENVQNRRKQHNNTSGYPGVIRPKNQNKWTVTVNHNGVQKYVGAYKNLDEAVNARRLAEIQFNPYKQFVKREAN